MKVDRKVWPNSAEMLRFDTGGTMRDNKINNNNNNNNNNNVSHYIPPSYVSLF